MDNKDSRINQILSHLAKAGSIAAGSVTDAVTHCGNAVGDKYKGVKLTLELNRLHDEQDLLFTEIGRMMFQVNNGDFEATNINDEGEPLSAQDEIDRLIALAGDNQKDIDALSKEIHDLDGDVSCTSCNKMNDESANYCSSCGAKLK